jgi:hypothetical protein
VDPGFATIRRSAGLIGLCWLKTSSAPGELEFERHAAHW